MPVVISCVTAVVFRYDGVVPVVKDVPATAASFRFAFIPESVMTEAFFVSH